MEGEALCAIRTLHARQQCGKVNLGELTSSENSAWGRGIKMWQEMESREGRDRSWGPCMPHQAGMWRGAWHCQRYHPADSEWTGGETRKHPADGCGSDIRGK